MLGSGSGFLQSATRLKRISKHSDSMFLLEKCGLTLDSLWTYGGLIPKAGRRLISHDVAECANLATTEFSKISTLAYI